MPIYEYLCRECNHAFDALQKLSDDPLTDCPDCGKPALRKLLSAPNFRLKGSGWYETDFKDKNQRNLAGDAGKGDNKGSGKEADKGSGKKSGQESGKESGKGTDKKSASTDSKSSTGKTSSGTSSGS